MQYNLVCFRPGDKHIFSIDIDENKSVDQLKQMITRNKERKLDDFPPEDLTLYKIEVDISNYNQYGQIVADMSRSDYVFPQKEELIPIAEISYYF
jgi:hypothetical protein